MGWVDKDRDTCYCRFVDRVTKQEFGVEIAIKNINPFVQRKNVCHHGIFTIIVRNRVFFKFLTKSLSKRKIRRRIKKFKRLLHW